MKRRFFYLPTSLILLTGTGIAAPSIALRPKNVIVSATAEARSNVVVLVDADRITAVTTSVPTDAELVDLPGMTLIPGLIDAHTHMSLDVLAGNEALQVQAPDMELALRAARHAAIDLTTGTTTARVLSEPNFIDITYRAFFNKDLLPAPRVIVATRAIAASNGHGVTSVRADGADEVRKIARINLKAGADWIKLYVTGGVATPGSTPTTSYYTRAEIEAAVEEAHRVGKRVAAHAYGGPGADDAIAAGVDSIEHGLFLTDAQLERMAAKGVVFGATLGVFLHVPGPPENPSWSEEIRSKFLAARAAAIDSLARAKVKGVPIVMGTDASHGRLWEEAMFAVEAGFTRSEALAALTENAARLLQMEDQIGTLSAGKLADIVGVEGNPLEDVHALERVRFVMKAGRVYRRP